MTPPDYNPQAPQTTQVIMADLVARLSKLVRGHKKVNHPEDPVCTPLRRPIKEDSNFKDDEDPSVDYVDIIGTEEQLELHGYRRHMGYTIMSWVVTIITCGALRLIFYWWPTLMLFSTHMKCSLQSAEKILVVETYKKDHRSKHVAEIEIINSSSLLPSEACRVNGWDRQAYFELKSLGDSAKLPVRTPSGIFKDLDEIRRFDFKKYRFIWDVDNKEFYLLTGIDCGIDTHELHEQRGISARDQYLRRAVYGPNLIDVPLQTIWSLIFTEVLNPFYVFEIFSFILWYLDDYLSYASAIFVMSLVSIITAVIQTRRNQRNLRSTVHSSDVANVLRENNVITVPTELLVPGDVLVIPSHGCVMHCDAVLLTGHCIVNESMLTGESVPVTKTTIPGNVDLKYDIKEHARHTLYCGTSVIQTRYYGEGRVCAVVVRTGFHTSKGSLVRSILYPAPVDFEFERDSYKFIQVLAGIAAVGFVYTVFIKVSRGHSLDSILKKAFDLITVVVPPALPAAMTVGQMYAQMRLKNHHIYCISPRSINVAGSINCVCFDKTGTLTEDGLDMWGIVPVTTSKFLPCYRNVSSMSSDHLLMSAMVTCHSITSIDGKLSGDPLDFKMFESTGWLLEEPETSEDIQFDLVMPVVVRPPNKNTFTTIEQIGQEIGIIRQFPFSSSLQCMSVIAKHLSSNLTHVYTKGSPEKILSLCNPSSIPPDFDQVLQRFTKQGYRVIAAGYRALKNNLSYVKTQRLTREQAECDLTLLGLIILENRLNPESAGVLDTLRSAAIRIIMVTGDNMLTALSVARDCGIVLETEDVITVHGVTVPPYLYFTAADMNVNQTINSNSIKLSTIMSSNSGNSVNLNMDLLEAGLLSPSSTTANTPIKCSQRYTFALTGKTWSLLRQYCPELIPKIITRASVFSRMSPDQKQQLVQELQGIGYYVAMCGDGANDCGALKAAHTGISLSEAESSVASPFTSRKASVECVVRVIREGRAALVTSVGIFKFMAGYSLVQFVSVIMLYSIDNNLSDYQYLYIDLFLISLFAFSISRTSAYEGPLVKQRPETSLVSALPLTSLIGQLVISIAIQLISFIAIRYNDWFVPFQYKEDGSLESFENYAVFSVSALQYIILALVFNKGPPYRQGLQSNWCLSIISVVIVAFTIYLFISPFEILRSKFELKLPPDNSSFFYVVLALGLINLALAVFHEKILCDRMLVKFLSSRSHKSKSWTTSYAGIEHELQKMPDWPPLSNDRFSSSSSSPFSYTSPEQLSPTVRSTVQQNGTASNGVNLSLHRRFHSESEESNYATPAGSLQHI
ncbi:probable cation-transporting ATPase 13A3 isoform X2 [Myzus persicae]|uniref:probable cation-transporting ATPase 13A3 isoform X1 n=2 Tax=Myzus persicae TaxID=13164 RepID=UPI000B933FCA|nr:probable cation-transporting ATPase 13A3 isoform X1 [Myzus persicae]XP_022160996.1 probable cation-transporting ATPase 13A3 isoform X2 [Myzus persicae]